MSGLSNTILYGTKHQWQNWLKVWTCQQSRRHSASWWLKKESFWIKTRVQPSLGVGSNFYIAKNALPHMTIYVISKTPRSWIWLVHKTHHRLEQGALWNVDDSDGCAHSEEGYSVVVEMSVIPLFNFNFLLAWGYFNAYSCTDHRSRQCILQVRVQHLGIPVSLDVCCALFELLKRAFCPQLV